MKELKDYPVKLEIPVRWSDMDAFVHVNNGIYLKWVEIARVEYFTKYITGDMNRVGLGIILAKQVCTYIFPITFPDTVHIGFRVVEILDDRLLCEAKIYSEKYKKLCAIAKNTVMAYNFTTLRKGDIPVDWIMKIQEIEP